jgi:hypothetical protein
MKELPINKALMMDSFTDIFILYFLSAFCFYSQLETWACVLNVEEK